MLITLESHEGRVVLAVHDQGPGIPAGEVERVFERFYRLPREQAAGTGGTGIGLSVVRELAREYGASCRAEPAPEGGARLIVDLPAANGVQRTAPA